MCECDDFRWIIRDDTRVSTGFRTIVRAKTNTRARSVYVEVKLTGVYAQICAMTFDG